eukprot:4768142-Prymnesium_polylepis.1
MAPSGVGGVEPLTGIATEQLGVDDAGFVDQAIISEMHDGVTDDSACQDGTLLCVLHATALQSTSPKRQRRCARASTKAG